MAQVPLFCDVWVSWDNFFNFPIHLWLVPIDYKASIFWFRQELKESQSPFVCACGPNFSNLSFWLRSPLGLSKVSLSSLSKVSLRSSLVSLGSL